jgi:hypothetical protein
LEIKTKYNIEDEVYYLSDNDQIHSVEAGKVKIVEGTIAGVHTNTYSDVNITYTLRVASKHITVNEKFVSKDIKELFQRVLKESDENYRIKLDK